MERRRIGSLDVSMVGIGGNNFGTSFFGPDCDQAEVTRIVEIGARTELAAGSTDPESVDAPLSPFRTGRTLWTPTAAARSYRPGSKET